MTPGDKNNCSGQDDIWGQEGDWGYAGRFELPLALLGVRVIIGPCFVYAFINGACRW